MAKGTFSEVQSLDKGKIVKKVVIVAIVLVALVVAVFVIKQLMQEEEVEEVKQTVTTPMVPSTIKYYDPTQEKTYDTGADYIILSSGGQNIKVDSQGNVSYVSSTGQTVSTKVSDEEKDAAISQAYTIMQTDEQAKLALAGLESRLPEEEEEAAPKEMTQSELLNTLLDDMEISYSDFLNQVYSTGATIDDVYTMLWMYDNDEAVIKSIMDQETKTEETEEKKSMSVSIEKLGGTETTTVTTEDDGYEYPEWMQSSSDSITDSMTALVNSLSSMSGTTTATATTTAEAKKNWLDAQQSSTTEAGYSGKITKWDLVAGTVIPITLVTGINTDLPGDVIGLVRQDIYDTLTGTNVLIPKGSRVMATYNNSVSFGQTSVQIAWTQLITPDGYVYTLPSFQGVSADGYAGVKGKTNNHFWKILGGSLLGSIINYGTNASEAAITSAADSVGNSYVSEAASVVGGTTLDTLSSFGTQYASQWASLQPTITIKTGAQIQMLVNDTVSFER